mgnify:CR=1 FL=1
MRRGSATLMAASLMGLIAAVALGVSLVVSAIGETRRLQHVADLVALAVAELHSAFEAHAAEFARGPADDEVGRPEAAAGHGLGAQAVAFPQHNGHQGHGEAARHHEEPARVAHHGVLLLRRTHHEAWGVAEGHNGQVEGIAQLHEACGLVGAVTVDGAREVNWVICDETHRFACDSNKSGDHTHPKVGSEFEY